jgi:phospholipase D1/2
MGKKFKERFHLDSDGEEDEGQSYPRHPAGSCRVQAVRSVSDWSHGVLTEHSIQNACESLFYLDKMSVVLYILLLQTFS